MAILTVFFQKTTLFNFSFPRAGMNVSVTSGNDSTHFSQTFYFCDDNLRTFTNPNVLIAKVPIRMNPNSNLNRKLIVNICRLIVSGVVAGGHGAGDRHQHALDLLHSEGRRSLIINY